MLQQPSSKVLRKAYHRPTLPKTCCLCPVIIKDLAEGELLGQRIRLIYQGEATVVVVNAIALVSAEHGGVSMGLEVNSE